MRKKCNIFYCSWTITDFFLWIFYCRGTEVLILSVQRTPTSLKSPYLWMMMRKWIFLPASKRSTNHLHPRVINFCFWIRRTIVNWIIFSLIGFTGRAIWSCICQRENQESENGRAKCLLWCIFYHSAAGQVSVLDFLFKEWQAGIKLCPATDVIWLTEKTLIGWWTTEVDR